MWLLAEETARKMEAMWRSGIRPTAAQQEQFFAYFGPIVGATSLPRNASIAGSILEIRVEGVLTQKPDLFAWFFGGGNCTYENIQAALALAEADPSIKEVAWKFGSPGGYVVGLFETLASIEACTKKMTVSASMALSSAYAMAALAGRGGKIEAVTPASMFGCIGVATAYRFCDDMTVIDITSTEAPDKRPDVRTEEGKAVVVAELDAIHDLFADAIARGRGTTVKNVNATFGRGRTLLAGEAKKLGMIDKISKPQVRAIKPATEPDLSNDQDDDDPDGPEASNSHFVVIDASKAIAQIEAATSRASQAPPAAPQAKPISSAGAEQPNKKGAHMDLATLQAQHPELYNQIVNTAKAEGSKEGIALERDRVAAHLEMGKECGAMDVALAAVESGEQMTQKLTAKYVTAGLNKNSQAARQADDSTVERAVGAAAADPPTAATKDLGDQVVAAMSTNTTASTNEHGVLIVPSTLKPRGARA